MAVTIENPNHIYSQYCHRVKSDKPTLKYQWCYYINNTQNEQVVSKKFDSVGEASKALCIRLEGKYSKPTPVVTASVTVSFEPTKPKTKRQRKK